MKIPTKKLREVIELAKKATPGPWTATHQDVAQEKQAVYPYHHWSDKRFEIKCEAGHDTTKFVARVDPTTIQHILERLIAAEEVIGFYADGNVDHEEVKEAVSAGSIGMNRIFKPKYYGHFARAHLAKYCGEEGKK